MVGKDVVHSMNDINIAYIDNEWRLFIDKVNLKPTEYFLIMKKT